MKKGNQNRERIKSPTLRQYLQKYHQKRIKNAPKSRKQRKIPQDFNRLLGTRIQQFYYFIDLMIQNNELKFKFIEKFEEILNLYQKTLETNPLSPKVSSFAQLQEPPIEKIQEQNLLHLPQMSKRFQIMTSCGSFLHSRFELNSYKTNKKTSKTKSRTQDEITEENSPYDYEQVSREKESGTKHRLKSQTKLKSKKSLFDPNVEEKAFLKNLRSQKIIIHSPS